MFSYEHLASFCATVEEGSYSQAAKKLGKDRTTIREQIKALEDSYAMTLFEIQGKKAVASEEGMAIYRQAKLLVRNSEYLDSRMMDSYKTEFTHLDIYHDILVPNALILEIERYMSQHFKHIKINWLHRNRDEVLSELCEKKNALAIMQNKVGHAPERTYEFLNLGTNELAAYCQPNHALMKLDEITIGDLQITKQYVSENHLYAIPELLSVSTDQRIISNNDVLLKLLQDDGWAIISRRLAAPMVEAGKLVEMDIKETVNALRIGIAFYYPVSLRESHEISGLLAMLKEYASEHLN